MNWLWKSVSIVIILSWTIMTGLLIRREIILPMVPLGNAGYQSLLKRGLPLRQNWFGIYYQGEKVGFSTTSLGSYREKDFSGYVVQNRTFLTLSILGEQNQVNLRAFLILDGNFKLQRFSMALESGPHTIDFKGTLTGRTLDLKITSAGNEIHRTLVVGDEFLLSNTMTPFLVLPTLEPGITYMVNIFDPLTLGTGQARIKVDKAENFLYRGKKWDAYLVTVEYKGIITTSWINEDGEVLKQETPLGWVMEKETSSEAMRFRSFGAPPELLTDLAIQSDTLISDPRQVKYLKVQLSGPELGRFPVETERQKVVEDSGSEKVIEIFTESPYQEELPVPAAALTPTAFIQSDDEKIIHQAHEIAGDSGDAWEMARKLSAWVYNAVEKKPSITIPSAVEVLFSRQGDCNEHTTLYVALARAVKIPALICVGLVYQDGAFYYHAWPKVFVGKWVSIDPTFGQEIADATHIELLSGDLDKQIEIVSLVGRLKVKVLDYR